ncbi:fimbrial protein [Escherichia coli]|uniref:fimbrial protein n=1 Tax=Escherichia coli TaxID=562 RepID=UPI0017F94D70|nr:fimbrial protein [Escherichia coli]EFC4278541.1 fimbrial protein [Escherichia coli]EFK6687246.1 fimbrial protein [Escherichia coli]MDS1454965.1 fimbrial protein [Escherichia coli]MDS1460577.1 fimbrial protein [Escherichia coli]
MGKTISIKVLFGIYLLLMAGKVFAFSCNVDGGSSIGAGTTSVYVNLDPVIQPGQNLVQVFANTAPDATKASGVGVTLMRNGKILATGENVSLGTVNKSKVPLGLSATYGQTGNKVSAGTVQSVIGVTFIYE